PRGCCLIQYAVMLIEAVRRPLPVTRLLRSARNDRKRTDIARSAATKQSRWARDCFALLAMTTKRECHCEERSDEAISPLCGNRRLSQFVEQRLGLFEVGGVEAFGEPAEDRGEQGGRLLRPALLAAQAGEAHPGAQFPGLRVLSARDVDAFLDGRLGIAHRAGAGEQGLTPEPIKLGFKRRSPRLFHHLQPGSGRYKRRFGLAARQLRIGLQCQQSISVHPWAVAVHPLCDLG